METRQTSAMDSSTTHQKARSVVVISGGTASNEILDAFVHLFDSCNFVLPVSDNGGSSSEIIRVLGGPSLGDIRSRLVRLIPDTPDKAGIKALFGYRLPSSDDFDDVRIKQEWLEIVEGSHSLWRDIPPDRREAIRAFLVHFEHAILRRAQRRFNFRSGSVGNFWLAGAQLFVRSLQSAIFLFSSVCGIGSQHAVIPCINTNSLVTIAAELEDGSRIVGQNEISHPSNAELPHAMEQGSYTPSSAIWGDCPGSSAASASASVHKKLSLDTGLRLPHTHLQRSNLTSAAASPRSPSRAEPVHHSHMSSGLRTLSSGAHSAHSQGDDNEDDELSVIARTHFDMQYHADVDSGEFSFDTNPQSSTSTHSHLQPAKAKAGNIVFTKNDTWQSLQAKIHRIIYLNTYGQETFPSPSSTYLNALRDSEVLVYSCGSLYTSLIPPLALSGVGSAIAMSRSIKKKVLLLNGTFDRESEGLTARDFVRAVTDHLNGTAAQHPHLEVPPGRRHGVFLPEDYITHLVYLEQGLIPVDVDRLQSETRIACIKIPGCKFDEQNLQEALRRIVG